MVRGKCNVSTFDVERSSVIREISMSEIHSDSLVVFGATGDLAYKKIFPTLQAIVKGGRLAVPVIGVAREKWDDAMTDLLVCRDPKDLYGQAAGIKVLA